MATGYSRNEGIKRRFFLGQSKSPSLYTRASKKQGNNPCTTMYRKRRRRRRWFQSQIDSREKEKKMWLRLAVSPMHVDVLDCARPFTQQTRDGEEMWMFLCCIQENISLDRIERKRNECEQHHRGAVQNIRHERDSLSLSLGWFGCNPRRSSTGRL